METNRAPNWNDLFLSFFSTKTGAKVNNNSTFWTIKPDSKKKKPSSENANIIGWGYFYNIEGCPLFSPWLIFEKLIYKTIKSNSKATKPSSKNEPNIIVVISCCCVIFLILRFLFNVHCRRWFWRKETPFKGAILNFRLLKNYIEQILLPDWFRDTWLWEEKTTCFKLWGNRTWS